VDVGDVVNGLEVMVPPILRAEVCKLVNFCICMCPFRKAGTEGNRDIEWGMSGLEN
jgi:hypothetical protein